MTDSSRPIAAVLEWQETTDNCLRYATFARQRLDCKNMAESCKTAYAYNDSSNALPIWWYRAERSDFL